VIGRAELVWRLGVWLGAWALVPHASFAALTLSLVASTLLLRVSAVRWRAWPSDLRVGIGAFGIALGLATLAPQTESLVRREGLDGLAPRARAAWVLDRTPSVFPTRLVPGERHFVLAPSAERVALLDEARDVRTDGLSLGHGLFAIDAPVTSESAVIAIDDTPSLTLDPPRAPVPRIGCTTEDRVVVLGAPRSSRVTVVDTPSGRTRTERHDEPVRACVSMRDAIVWGTDRAVLDGTHRWVGGPVDAMVAVGDVIAVAVGNGLRFVRHTERGFEPLRDVALGFSPVHVVANEDSVLVARGRRIVRVAIPTRGHEEQASEVWRTTLPGDVIAMTVRGARLAITTNAIDAIDTVEHEVGNHYVEDAVLELDARTLAIARVHRTARRTRRQEHPGAVDSGLLPRALAFDGEKLVVAFSGSGELGGIDGRGDLRLRRFPRALATPTALTIPAPGVRVVLAEPEGRLGIWRDEDWQTIELAPASPGARAFHAPTRSGLACASCHVEGGDATHRLGPTHGSSTPRAAPALANLALTPPYFRSAAYGSLETLIDESTHLFGGWREEVDVRALVAWLEGRARGGTATLGPRGAQGAHAAPRSLDDMRDGLDAFVAAGCADCHAFPAFTDRRVRTGAELGRAERGRWDTPSLVGLARTSHDRFADGEGVHRVDAESYARIARFLETL
jgi:hypothetical protein